MVSGFSGGVDMIGLLFGFGNCMVVEMLCCRVGVLGLVF